MTRVLCLFFMLTCFASLAQGSFKLTDLGERLGSCQNLEYDDFIVTVSKSLQKETQNLFFDDKLTAVLVEQPDCYRVGTEIQIHLEDDPIPYLGKAIIDEIEVLSPEELKKHKNTPYTKSSLEDYVSNTRDNQYGILKIRVTEKVTNYYVNQEYERLPTCFPSYGDWESIRLTENDKALVDDIKSGRVIAQISNGTFNCYKVGIRARIQVAGDYETDHGNIIPTELYVIHYSQLTSKHAKYFGQSVSELKSEMEKNKDVDGGYTTIVVFDYEKPRETPPEISETQSLLQ